MAGICIFYHLLSLMTSTVIKAVRVCVVNVIMEYFGISSLFRLLNGEEISTCTCTLCKNDKMLK